MAAFVVLLLLSFHSARTSCGGPLAQEISHNFGGGLHDELMLCDMDPCFEILQAFALPALDFSRHDGRAPVNLEADMVDHDAGPAVFQLPLLEVLIRPLNGTGTIILAWASQST